MIDVVVPELGLAAGDVIVVHCWLARIGDEVLEGDRLVELLIDEIAFDVASPANGRLASLHSETDDIVHVGDLLARVEPPRDT